MQLRENPYSKKIPAESLKHYNDPAGLVARLEKEKETLYEENLRYVEEIA
jgi:hypothetical protein